MLFGFPSIGGSTTGAGSQCVDLSFQPSKPPMKSEPPAKRPAAPTKLEREATRGTAAARAMGRYVRTIGRMNIRIDGGTRTGPDKRGDENGRRRNKLMDKMVESCDGATWRRPVWLGPHLSGGMTRGDVHGFHSTHATPTRCVGARGAGQAAQSVGSSMGHLIHTECRCQRTSCTNHLLRSLHSRSRLCVYWLCIPTRHRITYVSERFAGTFKRRRTPRHSQ